MALSWSLLFLTFVVVRAQKSSSTNDISPTSSLKAPSTKIAPTKILSYNPNQVCFNPQYDSFFRNALLSTSPIPKPNIYFDPKVPCPTDIEHSFDSHFPPIVSPWLNHLPSDIAPLMCIPTLSNDSRIEHGMLRYLKRVKNALHSDPSLSSKSQAAASSPRNYVGTIFLSADTLPKTLSKVTENTEQNGVEARNYRSRRKEEGKAEKMASYMKDYGRRRKARGNEEPNKYPLPKFVYGKDQIPQPTTAYNRTPFLAEIYRQCFRLT